MNLLCGKGAPVASTIPAEGATGRADTTMMQVSAPHPHCAYKWLEHSDVQGALGRRVRLVWARAQRVRDAS